MLTPFGLEVRKLRIETGTKLKDLAEHLKVSSAYLSSVEYGKQELPERVVEGVVRFFHLKAAAARDLRQLADRSRRAVRIDLQKSSAPARELATVFARRFDTIDQKTIDRLLGLLNGGDKG